jgi:hypothetical protein
MIWTLEVLFKRQSNAVIDQAFAQDDSTPLMWAIEVANLELCDGCLRRGQLLISTGF